MLPIADEPVVVVLLRIVVAKRIPFEVDVGVRTDIEDHQNADREQRGEHHQRPKSQSAAKVH